MPNQLLWSYEIRPAHGIARSRELIAVTVAQIHRDPVVRDCLVESALKIAVAYVEKIIALKYAGRRYPVAHENAEDLATNFIIGRSVKHGHLRSRDASVTLSHSALAVRRHPCNLESYPRFREQSHS